MEATIVLVLLFTLLVGGMMLALTMGYRSIEESRAQQAARPAAAVRIPHAVMVPSFFAKVEDRTVPPNTAFDEALLAQLERYVKAEHAIVAQFVHLPSVDSLYHQSGSSLQVH